MFFWRQLFRLHALMKECKLSVRDVKKAVIFAKLLKTSPAYRKGYEEHERLYDAIDAVV